MVKLYAKRYDVTCGVAEQCINDWCDMLYHVIVELDESFDLKGYLKVWLVDTEPHEINDLNNPGHTRIAPARRKPKSRIGQTIVGAIDRKYNNK